MADDKRISIYIGEPLARLLDGFGANRSGRINSVAWRYLELVDDELKRASFSRDEWCAILDASNGAQIETYGGPDFLTAWANVADSPELDEKWGIDHIDVAKRMQAMSYAGRAAVWEAAARFWAASADLSTDDALRRAGVL